MSDNKELKEDTKTEYKECNGCWRLFKQEQLENQLCSGCFNCPNEFCGGVLFKDCGMYRCDKCGSVYEPAGNGRWILVNA